jgi:uncharacterized cupin superfamily protein
MNRPIINVAEAPVYRGESGGRFEFQMASLARAAGGRSIGANVTTVKPGKAGFPLHHHHANEEHFFILSGKGVLRVGAETFPVKPQDYIVNLPGGPETAHQLVNTGDEDLVYLAISTMRFLLRDEDKDAVGYWDGEDGSGVSAIVTRAQEQST